ncbi:Histone acetyltransferase kat2b [Blyttiomyces sp. JEL0837]|nr:Histone acetyltransferase kat2b [Blyttiomyces sp. JEL0837]
MSLIKPKMSAFIASTTVKIANIPALPPSSSTPPTLVEGTSSETHHLPVTDFDHGLNDSMSASNRLLAEISEYVEPPSGFVSSILLSASLLSGENSFGHDITNDEVWALLNSSAATPSMLTPQESELRLLGGEDNVEMPGNFLQVANVENKVINAGNYDPFLHSREPEDLTGLGLQADGFVMGRQEEGEAEVIPCTLGSLLDNYVAETESFHDSENEPVLEEFVNMGVEDGTGPRVESLCTSSDCSDSEYDEDFDEENDEDDEYPVTVTTTSMDALDQFKCQQILNRLREHPAAWPFQHAVDPIHDGAPDYYDIITKPMHISEIEKRLTTGRYGTVELFVEDIKLMFDNCFKYNQALNQIHRMGFELESYATRLFSTLFPKVIIRGSLSVWAHSQHSPKLGDNGGRTNNSKISSALTSPITPGPTLTHSNSITLQPKRPRGRPRKVKPSVPGMQQPVTPPGSFSFFSEPSSSPELFSTPCLNKFKFPTNLQQSSIESSIESDSSLNDVPTGRFLFVELPRQSSPTSASDLERHESEEDDELDDDVLNPPPPYERYESQQSLISNFNHRQPTTKSNYQRQGRQGRGNLKISTSTSISKSGKDPNSKYKRRKLDLTQFEVSSANTISSKESVNIDSGGEEEQEDHDQDDMEDDEFDWTPTVKRPTVGMKGLLAQDLADYCHY